MLTNAISAAIGLSYIYLRLVYRNKQYLRTNIQIGLLLPWLVSPSCGRQPRPDFTPSAPPLDPYSNTAAKTAAKQVPKEFPPAAPPKHIPAEDLPPSYDETMRNDRTVAPSFSEPIPPSGTTASTQYDPPTTPEESYSIENIKTKQVAKEAAEYWLKATKKLVRKCFGYEKKINNKVEAEQWWKEFSEGWFVKRWIGNWMMENKRKGKAGKAGQLLAALAKADDFLRNMEECIQRARVLGSKKAYKDLTKRKEKLYGQLLNIRNAMAEHITPIGVGRGADKQVRPTRGSMPPAALL